MLLDNEPLEWSMSELKCISEIEKIIKIITIIRIWFIDRNHIELVKNESKNNVKFNKNVRTNSKENIPFRLAFKMTRMVYTAFLSRQ